MGWHPRPPAEALPLAGPLWFYALWFKTPDKPIPLSYFWFNHIVIHTSQGPLVLVIPLRHEGSPITGLPSSAWWVEHWLKSLKTAYGKAPYFEELYWELKALLRTGAEGPLVSLGHSLHRLLTRWLMADDLLPPQCEWRNNRDAEKIVNAGLRDTPASMVLLKPALSVWHALMYYGREVRLFLLENQS